MTGWDSDFIYSGIMLDSQAHILSQACLARPFQHLLACTEDIRLNG